jgi:DNA-binding NtrC family response regulator
MAAEVKSRASAGAQCSVLVVDTARQDLAFACSVLAAWDFQVLPATSFDDAKVILTTQAPDVLVAAVRLAEYNGLHLVLRGKADRPNMAAVVISPSFDPVLLAEADAMKATFVVAPITAQELIAAVLRTLFRQAESVESIRPPFERRQLERRISAGVQVIEPERRENRDRRRGSRAADAV